MKFKIIQLLFLIFLRSNIFALSQDSLSIEQRSLDYFISKIDTIHFLCFNYKAFNAANGKIFLQKETYKGKIPLINITNKPLNILFNYDSLKTNNDYYLSLEAEETKYKFTPQYPFIKLVDELPKNDSISENDLLLSITNRFNLKYYFVIRIDVECKDDWIFDTFYIKLDLNGNPLSYIQTSAMK